MVPCLNCAEQALSSAYTFTGLRYKRGGTSADTGFDCSGFVRHVFGASCRLELPRTAREQYELGQEVAREDLHRGDLVFFRGRQGWHVGIYTGDGQFIHSPNRHGAVKVSSLSSGYYKRTYLGARRLTHDVLPPLLAGPVPPFLSFPLETEASGDN
jgi:cell wall-associated NlpC family hydrolase